MLDVNIIRENPDQVKAKIALKGAAPSLVDDFLAVDAKWRLLVKERDAKRAAQKEAGDAKNIDAAKELKQTIKSLADEIDKLDAERRNLLLRLPNLPDDDAPVGRDDSGNVILREVGERPRFDFAPLDHITLGERLNLLNFDKAGSAAGARFGYILNELVLLEFALIQLAMKEAVALGFTPVLPPVLVKPEIMAAMGKIKFLEDQDAFYLPTDNLYLVGSAEHSLGPLHLNDTLEAKDLPKRYIGFSTSFRREAGSYGRDTRGLLRRHQFNKVELFSFAHPEQSRAEHQFLLSFQERLMKALQLPYRVVDICTGDMTWGDRRQFDIETWLPGQNAYRETHSCSNTGDYQARGLNVRFRDQSGAVNFVHTLNGTAFSERPLIAILENYQLADSRVRVPDVLIPYVGQTIIKADRSHS